MASAVPGRLDSPDPWGDLALEIDTSAWSRVHHPRVRERWTRALLSDRLRISPAVRHEILLSAREGPVFDDLAEELSALRTAPLTAAVLQPPSTRCARSRTALPAPSDFPIVDYLVGAAAQETGAAVLHYDRDYDTLTEIMDFESVWVAPPGSLP